MNLLRRARGPSHVIADATFPTLIAMAQAMVQAPPAVDTAELALLVAKVRTRRARATARVVAASAGALIPCMHALRPCPLTHARRTPHAPQVFWSCTQLGLPPWLLVPGQLQAWFDTLLAMLEQPLPEGRPSDEEDDAKWPPFKVCTCTCAQADADARARARAAPPPPVLNSPPQQLRPARLTGRCSPRPGRRVRR